VKTVIVDLASEHGILPKVLPTAWRYDQSIDQLVADDEQVTVIRSHLLRKHGGLKAIISVDDHSNGAGLWLHVSASHPGRIPSYSEMCEVRDLFIPQDLVAVQVFVPKSEHVNIHHYTLHLWARMDQRTIPDLSEGV
jgi:hypothetical protein